MEDMDWVGRLAENETKMAKLADSEVSAFLFQQFVHFSFRKCAFWNDLSNFAEDARCWVVSYQRLST
jgi:hypothetical protein